MDHDHVLIKRGLYYCPNGQGYTGLKRKAGLYPASYALGLDGVTAVPFADADEFAPACWEETKLAEREATIAQQGEELARLREELRKANEPQWFYNPDDCEVCHYSPFEVIDYIDPDKSGVFEVSTGRPCASIWCAVRVNDDEDADERYTFTEHATEEAARQALESPKP